MAAAPAGPSRSFSNPAAYLDPYHIATNLSDSALLNSHAPAGGHDAEQHLNDSAGHRSAMSAAERRASQPAASNLSSSSRVGSLSGSRRVRTLPPWIDSYETDGRNLPRITGPILPTPVPPALAAKHHFSSTNPEPRRSIDGYIDDYATALVPASERGIFGQARDPVRGRKWDHVRDGDPVVVHASSQASVLDWRAFIKSSMYGPGQDEDRVLETQDFLDKQTPGYAQPWRGDAYLADEEKGLRKLRSKAQRRVWYIRLQRLLILHPLVPLVLRITVFTTSVIALSLSASIFSLTSDNSYTQNPSTVMAIVVDVIALPYICYITWDEYTGKPLGLRRRRAKVRLVMLDLYFIIFESANLSLAFDALTDGRGSCSDGLSTLNSSICRRNQTLAAILLIALFAWIANFSVSIYRLIERVTGRDEDDL